MQVLSKPIMIVQEWSDEQLIAQVARGDTAAYEMLYDRYSSAVMGLALKITGDRSLAEEVVQETFWRVWRKAELFRTQRGAFTSWFFGITRNLSIDVLRRQKTQIQPVEETEQIIEQAIDPSMNVPEAAWLREKQQQMRAAIETLPVEQRSVIEMAYFRGLTRQEIAQATGEPLGTIHTRARLALQKLREELQMQGFEE
ncbi:MAG TPA: sigma-70 family RNA polymerase sigma factor [Anaerolineales bacterium]|nr:sigma-70 family RNA polymerase sigma factor [Anaerolineales bacterium]